MNAASRPEVYLSPTYFFLSQPGTPSSPVNSNAFVRIVITFVVMLLALWVSFDVFASGSNALGKFYFYIMIGGAILGMLAPRRAFYLLIFLTAYLDLFKRLMILDSGLRQLDLYYVLGIAPMTLAGICFSVLYQMAVGGVRMRPLEGRITFFSFFMIAAIVAASALTFRSNFRALGDMVNSVAYLSLLFVVPALFRTPGEVRALLKFVIIMFIPSALYLIYQGFAGLSWWEMKYVRSGFTIEIRQLGEKIFRPFGTMNAAANASLTYGLFAALLIGGGFWKHRPGAIGERSPSLVLRLLGAAIFAFAAYRTFSRTGWITGIVAITCFVAFRRRTYMWAYYLTLGVVAALLMVSAGWMLKHKVLNEITTNITAGRSEEAEMSLRLATLNDRLASYENLLHNKRVWTPFGLRLSGYNEDSVRSSIQTHDALTELLLRIGYIPVAVAVFFGFWLLKQLHRYVYKSPPGLSRELAAAGLACSVALLLGGAVNGAQFVSYPTNFYFYFYLSIVVALMVHSRYEATIEEEQAALAPETDSAFAPSRPPSSLAPRRTPPSYA